MKNLGKFYNITNNGQAQGAGTSSGIINNPNEYQTAVVYDLISEGPIEGLVNGSDSIYLNQTPATIGNAGVKYNLKESDDVSLTASTLTIVDNNGSLFSGLATTDGTRTIRIVGGKKATTGTISITAGDTTVTSSSSFFASNDALSVGNSAEGTNGQYINITGAGYGGSVHRARILEYISTTSVRIDIPAGTTVSAANATVDKIAKISSITNNSTAVLAHITQLGTDIRDVSNVRGYLSSPTRTENDSPIYNHDNFQYAFRNGYRDQPWLATFRGIGSSSIVYSANQEVLQTDLSSITGSQSNVTSGGYTAASGNATASPITISASTMGISNQPEIDKLKINFKFPTLIASKKSSGDEAVCHVELRIFLGYKRAGDLSFTEVQIFGPTDAQIQARPIGRKTSNFERKFGGNSGFVQAETKAPFIETFIINLQDFQPFSDFQIKIERVNPVNARHGDYDHTNPCTLQSIEAIIEDRLSYPLSAYGALIFDAQSFSSLPTRGYEIKGLKVKVPTNYFPKGEGGRTLGEYDRNVTTGADTGNYQNWDGNFRGDIETFTNPDGVNYDLVWTDNPAWVFYDLVTNNRYGIGKYISADQIDKYELFKIARYCDELVSDGQGGTEPRFTSNLYLQEKAEALKVLKDVTSIFRGMLYWFDGAIQFSQNRYQSPVYTFSKANTVGLFKYTSSKQQYRSNQIRVTWNDPESMYKQAVEIVEDTNNILETGRIIPKDVVAFGCTSRGQAHRFGKWHILTEILETEGISFTTSINAGFLKPGDVVLVQDADRDDIRYSGRISTSSTTTTVNIDSAVDLSSGNTFKLSVIYPEGGAYLAQESAIINSTSYSRGDYIPQATVNGSLVSLNSSTRTYNAVDDSGDELELNWSPYSRVETQTITSTGASTTAVAVSSAFSSAPEQDYMWAIREYSSDGTLASGSAKQYVVTGINESQPSVYEITGIQYDATKFDSVDRGYVLDVGVDTNKPPSYQDEVPTPKSVTLTLKKNLNANTDNDSTITGGTANILNISWQHPTSIRTDSNGASVTSKYEHLSHYEIRHNANGKLVFETLKAGKDDNFINLPLSKYGIVTVQIRTVNTAGIKSQVIQKKIDLANQSASINTISRIGLLPTGGQINKTLGINSSTGLAEIGSATYEFIAANGETYLFSGTGAGNYQQSFSGMGASATAYLVFDADDTSDHLKAVKIQTDTTAQDADGNSYNFEYLAEVGAANAGISSATGTVTISLEENSIVGSSTTFRSDYSVGDRFIVDSSTDRFFATVTSITSDTEMEIDNIVPRAYSGASIFKLSYAPNFTRDTILARITTDGSTVYSLNTIFAITAGVIGADGSDGPKTGSGYLYYQSASATAPSAPSNSGVTYNFSNGTMSGGVIGTGSTDWNVTAPTFTGGQSSSKYWYVYYSVTESSSGSGSGTPTFDTTVYEGSNFVGLVRFTGTNSVADGSGGSLSFGSTGTTVIDGGNITTGTVNTARLNVSDIISTGSIIVSGSNVSSLTNDSAFINGGQVNSNVTSISGGAITTGTVNTARLNVSDIISTGSIIVSGSNVSSLTNDSAFINGGQVNSNVTSISGGVITTGTVAAARIDVAGVISAGGIIVNGSNISSLTNDSAFINGGQVNTNVTSISGGVITTGTINASRIQIDNVTLDTDGSGNLIIKTNGVNTTQIANNAVSGFVAATGSQYQDFNDFYPDGSASETKLGYAYQSGTGSGGSIYSPNEAVMVETGIMLTPSSGNTAIVVIGHTINNVDAASSSDFITLRLQYRVASTSGGVSSANYSDVRLYTMYGASAESFQTITGTVPSAFTYNGYYYQFRLTMRASGVTTLAGTTRTYGPATVTALTTVK